jgi:hypothetical protein
MFDPRRFRTGGYFLTGGSGGPGRPQEWDVNGLVPDGVSSIVLELSGRSRPKPIFGRSSPYYRLHPYRVTVSVVQNVFAFLNLPADPESAAHKTITWLSASGAPIRVMSLP